MKAGEILTEADLFCYTGVWCKPAVFLRQPLWDVECNFYARRKSTGRLPKESKVGQLRPSRNKLSQR